MIIPSDRIYMVVIAVGLTAAALGRATATCRSGSRSARPPRTSGRRRRSAGRPTCSRRSPGRSAPASRASRGVIIAPITGINPEEMPLFILPVLAAALVGGFTSFWITLAARLRDRDHAVGVHELRAPVRLDVGPPRALPFLVVIVDPRHPRVRACPCAARSSSASPTLGSGVVSWRWLADHLGRRSWSARSSGGRSRCRMR